MSTLASRLNERLDELRWSQEALAERCNQIEPGSISQVAIHKIATGKTKSTRKGPVLVENGERDKFQVLGRVLMAWNARKL